MVNILSVMASVPEELRDRFKKLLEELKKKYEKLDVAVVKAFQQAIMGDAVAGRTVLYCEEQEDASPTLLGEDKNFWYRRVVLTVEGVNLNGFYKPREELERTAQRQADHIIPSVNDHPGVDEGGIRVHPKDEEVSGFVFGIRGEEGEDGRYRLVGIDAIPKERPDLLNIKGVSIGYVADVELTPGEYKGVDYVGIQRNITLVHLARMVKQAPSCPPAISEGDAPPGLAVGCGYDAEGGEHTGDNEEDAVWSTKFINDLPDAAFAVIEPGGKKDEEGKTVPRSLRHFPHHNANVKNGNEHNTVDIPHLRNALARLPQSKLPENLKAKAKAHLVRHAKALGVGNYDEEEKDMGDDKTKELEKKLKELQDTVEAQDKEISGLKEKLEAKTKEYDELKEKHDRIEKELKALKDQIREELVRQLKDSYPGEEEGSCIFSDEEIEKMSDCEIMRLLKAKTGVDFKPQPVFMVQEQGGEDKAGKPDDKEDARWTVGVPGVAGWKEE